MPFAANAAFADESAAPMRRLSAASARVFIDPGHGGSDSGAAANGLEEKNVNLDISLQLRDFLQSDHGVEVAMARDDDSTVDLYARAPMANDWGADLFVSVHANAGGGTGFESFRFTGAPQETINYHNALHPATLAGMHDIANVTDRGLKTANFVVLRDTAMPAVLTENLFVDTVADADLLKDPAFITATARGHANGIAAHLGL